MLVGREQTAPPAPRLSFLKENLYTLTSLMGINLKVNQKGYFESRSKYPWPIRLAIFGNNIFSVCGKPLFDNGLLMQVYK